MIEETIEEIEDIKTTEIHTEDLLEIDMIIEEDQETDMITEEDETHVIDMILDEEMIGIEDKINQLSKYIYLYRNNGLCFICGEKDHWVSNCPKGAGVGIIFNNL